MFRQGDAGVVSRGDGYSFQQVLDLDLTAHLDKHLGPLSPPRLLAHGHEIVPLQLPPADRIKGQIERQHLDKAGRRNLLPGILLVKNLSGQTIHEQGGLGIALKGARSDLQGLLSLGGRAGLRFPVCLNGLCLFGRPFPLCQREIRKYEREHQKEQDRKPSALKGTIHSFLHRNLIKKV